MERTNTAAINPVWLKRCRTYGAPTARRGRQIIFGIDTQLFRAGLTFGGAALRA